MFSGVVLYYYLLRYIVKLDTRPLEGHSIYYMLSFFSELKNKQPPPQISI